MNAEAWSIPPTDHSYLGLKARPWPDSSWMLALFLDPVVEMSEAPSSSMSTSSAFSSTEAMIWLGVLLLFDPYHVSCDHLKL